MQEKSWWSGETETSSHDQVPDQAAEEQAGRVEAALSELQHVQLSELQHVQLCFKFAFGSILIYQAQVLTL